MSFEIVVFYCATTVQWFIMGNGYYLWSTGQAVFPGGEVSREERRVAGNDEGHVQTGPRGPQAHAAGRAVPLRCRSAGLRCSIRTRNHRANPRLLQ